jgi:DNA-binding IclR family transcriptional regulator
VVAAVGTRSKPAPDEATESTGSIGRAVAIMRSIGLAGPTGSRLSDLVTATGQPKATVRRNLLELIKAGWVCQDPDTRQYSLSSELIALGAVAAARHPLVDLARLPLARVAEQTGQTTYLSMRSGYDAVCIARHDGSAAVRIATLEVGMRRPLGVGAGSMCLLAFLPHDEILEIVRHRPAAYVAFCSDGEAELLAAAAAARARGHAAHRGRIIEGLSGIGVPVFGAGPVPVAAISVAFATERVSTEKWEAMLRCMTEEAGRLGDKLRLREERVG